MCNCLPSSFFLHLHPLSMSSPAAFVKSMRFLGESTAVSTSILCHIRCHVQAMQVPPASEFFANAECQGGFFAFMSWRLSFPLVLTGDPFLQMKENKFSGFLTSLGIFFKQIYNNIKHSFTIIYKAYYKASVFQGTWQHPNHLDTATTVVVSQEAALQSLPCHLCDKSPLKRWKSAAPNQLNHLETWGLQLKRWSVGESEPNNLDWKLCEDFPLPNYEFPGRGVKSAAKFKIGLLFKLKSNESMNFYQICPSYHDSLSRPRVSNSVPRTPGVRKSGRRIGYSLEILPPRFANDFHPTLPELLVGKKQQTSTVLEHVLTIKK